VIIWNQDRFKERAYYQESSTGLQTSTKVNAKVCATSQLRTQNSL